MDEKNIEQTEKMALLQEMITCGAEVYLWTYSGDGHLKRTNCPELVLDTIFDSIGCKTYMLEHGKRSGVPLVLGAPLGLMWCAAFERGDSMLHRMYVIGPVFNTEATVHALQDGLKEFDIPTGFSYRLVELLRELPVVSTPLFFQYGLMLHYCVTGQKLKRGDIQYQEQQRTGDGRQTTARSRDRYMTYSVERALMWMVREGNLGYQSALDRAGGISHGVQITGRPMEQAVISCAVFTSLCVRAAIEGGLSPDTAYSVGDSYIQSMTQCKTIPDLTAINHEMYVDFVQRVHRHRMDPRRSKQVQMCCDYIDVHLEEPITLKQMAVLSGYRDYYLSRKFQKETGLNINDYIKIARVEKAKMLLTATMDPIRDIARQLQFCSSSYFSQTFQKITGLTPHQWRENAGHPQIAANTTERSRH